MMVEGGCQCGAVRYAISGALERHALCHCSDCRASSGAPMVGWLAVDQDHMSVTRGEAKIFQSSEHGFRHFCTNCGTGLFYYNAVALPGIVDILSGTLDDPGISVPAAHIMVKERIEWMKTIHDLAEFETFPGM